MGHQERARKLAQAFGAQIGGGDVHSQIDAALQHQEPVVRDDKGRVLEVGDEVVVLEPGSYMRVASIVPVLDPGAPPGYLKLRLVAIREIITPSNAAVEGITRTRAALEFGPPTEPPPPAGATEPPPPAADDHSKEPTP